MKLARIYLLNLSVALCLASAVGASAESVTAYRQRLHDVGALLEQSLNNRSLRPRIKSSVVPLSKPTILETDSGTVTAGPVFDDVDLQMLVPEKGVASASAIRAASTRVEMSLLSLGTGRKAVDHQDTAKILRETSQRKEYDQSSWEKLLTDIMEALNNALRRVFGKQSNNSMERVSQIFGVAVIIGFSGLIIASAWLLAARYRAKPVAEATEYDHDPEAAMSSSQAARAAMASMDQGDHISAVRLWLRSILMHLNETGQIRLRDGITSREAVNQIKDTSLRAKVQPANQRFEECFYRFQKADSSDSNALLEIHRSVINP